MKYNTRYWFAKKIYPNYLLLFRTNKNKLGYRCYGIDRYIIDYIRNYTIDINVILKKLETYNINYICIDITSEILHIYTANDNKYTHYLHKYIVKDILNKIRVGVYR